MTFLAILSQSQCLGANEGKLGYDEIRKEGGTLPHDVDANSFLHVLLYSHIV